MNGIETGYHVMKYAERQRLQGWLGAVVHQKAPSEPAVAILATTSSLQQRNNSSTKLSTPRQTVKMADSGKRKAPRDVEGGASKKKKVSVHAPRVSRQLRRAADLILYCRSEG